MRHTTRGKNQRRRTPFTDAQELAVWCSRLEAHLEPLQLFERYAYAMVVLKSPAKAKRLEAQLRALFKARTSQPKPKHTPEYKTMVVKAYRMAHRGNRSKVLKQFGVTYAQLVTWKIQVKNQRWNSRETTVAARVLANWTPPTVLETKAAHEDFAARLAKERARESQGRVYAATRYTHLKELPVAAPEKVADDSPGARLTYIPGFEIIE